MIDQLFLAEYASRRLLHPTIDPAADRVRELHDDASPG